MSNAVVLSLTLIIFVTGAMSVLLLAPLWYAWRAKRRMMISMYESSNILIEKYSGASLSLRRPEGLIIRDEPDPEFSETPLNVSLSKTPSSKVIDMRHSQNN